MPNFGFDGVDVNSVAGVNIVDDPLATSVTRLVIPAMILAKCARSSADNPDALDADGASDGHKAFILATFAASAICVFSLTTAHADTRTATESIGRFLSQVTCTWRVTILFLPYNHARTARIPASVIVNPICDDVVDSTSPGLFKNLSISPDVGMYNHISSLLNRVSTSTLYTLAKVSL